MLFAWPALTAAQFTHRRKTPMTRTTLILVTFVLATGCGDSGNPTSPTSPTPAVDPTSPTSPTQLPFAAGSKHRFE